MVGSQGGMYNVLVVGGKTPLFEIQVKCQNKSIAKNVAALKYFQIYDFATFRKVFENKVNKTCEINQEMEEILTKQRELEGDPNNDTFIGDSEQENDVFSDAESVNESSEEDKGNQAEVKKAQQKSLKLSYLIFSKNQNLHLLVKAKIKTKMKVIRQLTQFTFQIIDILNKNHSILSLNIKKN